MSGVTITQPGLAIGRAAARPPRHIPARARLLARPAVAERQALAVIEAVFGRLSNGQYGRCEQCREPISAALLARQAQAVQLRACGCLALQQAR
jgi:hypothetical protein